MMEKLRQQGKDLGEAGFREYVHLEPDNIILVPFQTILNLAATCAPSAWTSSTRRP